LNRRGVIVLAVALGTECAHRGSGTHSL
jgi:hypothetical protein